MYISLSTSIREFAALKGLPWYESSLLSDIMGGRSAIMPKLSTEKIEDTMKCLSLNEPQAKAVLGALEVKGFTLIQGYVDSLKLNMKGLLTQEMM